MRGKPILKLLVPAFMLFSFTFCLAQTPRELVVLDEAMANRDKILECLRDDMEVIILNEGGNQIEELTEKLKEYKNLDAIHLLVCGKEGTIMLDGAPLENNSLGKYTPEFASWKDSFSSTGDLMIYTCNLAGSEQGKLIIRRLSAYTGLDIAASTNDTGNLGDKGDWKLEFRKGEVETLSCFDNQKASSFPGKFERKNKLNK